ncbi:hypothetical protein FACS189493_3590 [Spirochaetia bacterium]|nr:hypothetical protein FACS189493_3590 [Spirochaetia bacterium]
MASITSEGLKQTNEMLSASLGESDEEIDKAFFTWAERKNPFVNFAPYGGKVTSNAVIWNDELFPDSNREDPDGK